MGTPVTIESPPAWYPNTVTVVAGINPQQIAGSRPGRVTIAIENIGANDVSLSNVVDTNSPNIVVAAGAAVSIDTTGEVFAWSVVGSTLQVIETVNPVGTDGGGAMPRFFDAVKPGS